MGKCLVIKTDNSVTIQDLPAGDKFCPFIHDIVRWNDYDYFERVQFYSAKCQLWCNEAALCLRPMPPINKIVTAICHKDPMFGGMCITGLDDEESGEVLPIDRNIEEFGNRLIEIVKEDTNLENQSSLDLILMLAQKYKFKMFA